MRACTLIAGFVLGLAGMAAASAADLSRDVESAGELHYPALGRRMAPIVVYDYRPGIVVRAYWLPPWRHRHYFPHGVTEPRLGRLEHTSVTVRPPKPAKSFFRSWSTTSVFVPEPPAEPVPIPEPPLK